MTHRNTGRVGNAGGWTLVELLTGMLMMALILAVATPLGRKAMARHQLDAAARALATDLSEAKMKAIQRNQVVTLKLESDRVYRLDSRRELPSMIRFAPESADSVAFNGMGGVAGGGTQTIILADPDGEAMELKVFGAGGVEVRKL